MFESYHPNDMKSNGNERIHSRFYLTQTFYDPLIILISIDL